MRHRSRIENAPFLKWVAAAWAAIALVTVLNGCGGSSGGGGGTTPPPPPLAAQRQTGTVTTEGLQVLATMKYEGQPMVFQRAGHPLDGLEIKVNKGINPGATFELSSGAITGHSFARQIDSALTPMIRIRCDQPVTDPQVLTPVTVTLPNTVPADAAMGEYPVAVSLDPSASWLNFVPYSVNRESRRVMVFPRLMGSADSTAVGGPAPFFLAKRANALPLTRASQSGFTPGVDDWPFINLGTTTAQGGICTGMSVGAAYHYALKRVGNGPLRQFKPFNEGTICSESDTDPLRPCAYDDRDAWLMCQTLQERFGTMFQLGLLDANGDPTLPDGMAPFEAILQAKAIHESGWPALVAIQGEDGGHAVLCYATTENGLLIADPNAPGKSREILMDGPLRWKTFGFDSWFDWNDNDDAFENYDRMWVVDISQLSLQEIQDTYHAAELGRLNQDLGAFDVSDWCRGTQQVQGEARLQIDNEVLFLSDSRLTNKLYELRKYLYNGVETTFKAPTDRGFRINLIDPEFTEPDEDCDWCQDTVPDTAKPTPRARIHIPIFRTVTEEDGDRPVWHEAMLLDVKAQPMKLKE
ncbi:MAG: hypothetical protein ACO1SV_03080 [Fimbriimonas sp.]